MQQELVEFITSRTHLEADDISPDLELANDIGFYGLDAISFLEDFFAIFEIKNIHDFDIDLYIDGSVDFAPRPLNWIKNILGIKKKKHMRSDLTVGHLQKVINEGRWFDTEYNR